MKRAVPALLLALTLPACGGGDDPTVAADPAPAQVVSSAPAPVPADPPAAGAVVLRGDGVVLGGTPFVFGTATRDQVQPALEAALGAVEAQEVPCPAGPRTAVGANGFDLIFGGETLLGWDEASGQVATEGGLTLGSTREEVAAALPDAEFSEDTLGPEFSSPSGLAGFLDGTDPTSTVTGLTGGEQCVQR